jgi:hypothetical protein
MAACNSAGSGGFGQGRTTRCMKREEVEHPGASQLLCRTALPTASGSRRWRGSASSCSAVHGSGGAQRWLAGAIGVSVTSSVLSCQGCPVAADQSRMA